MNKKEVILMVAERSGVDPDDCAKVLDSFEDVFSEEIIGNKWKNVVFQQIYSVLTRIKNRKESTPESIS